MRRNSDVFLPVTFNRLTLWPGHRAETCSRLHAILDQAAQRSGGLSLAERALFSVCECWSAVATKSLEWHLGAEPEQRLRSLAAVYMAMGAKRAARAMDATVRELVSTRNELQRAQRIAALEVMMFKARETVDEILGRFAMRLQGPALDAMHRPAAPAPVAAAAVVVGARRAAVPRLRRPLPAIGARAPARSYVRWRTENQAARQQD